MLLCVSSLTELVFLVKPIPKLFQEPHPTRCKMDYVLHYSIIITQGMR